MPIDFSFTAGRLDPDAAGAWAATLDVDALTLLAEIATTTLRDVAASAGDLDALVESAFMSGFEPGGLPRTPWIVEGLLVACGARLDSVGASHQCRFVAVGDDWVWQVPTHLVDVMRQNGKGVRTVTLLVAEPGLEFDVVTSTARNGTHKRKTSERWRVGAGELTLIERKGAGAGREHR